MTSGLYGGNAGLYGGNPGLYGGNAGLWSGASGLAKGVGGSGPSYDPALIAPAISMAVPQLTYPPQLNAVFDISTLTTDNVRLVVASDAAFTSVVLDQSIVVGAGSQAFPGLSSILSGKQYYRERIERASLYYGPWSNIVTHGDATAPVLSSPTAVAASASTANLGVTSDTGEGVLYYSVLLSTLAAPTPTAFLAGATGGVATGSTYTPSAGVNSFNGVSTPGQTTTISAFSSGSVTDTACTLSINVNAADGTLYWYVGTSATPPSVSALKAGTGAAAYGSQAVSVSGAQVVPVSGLSGSTTYYAYAVYERLTSYKGHYFQQDYAPNNSNVASSGAFNVTSGTGTVSGGSFTTAAAAGPVVWNPSDKAAGITLSNGNLTAAQGTGGAWSGGRSLLSRDGVIKRFAAWRLDSLTGGQGAGMAITNSSWPVTSFPGGSFGSIGYYQSGDIYPNGSSLIATGVPFAQGDIIGLCFHDDTLGARAVWFTKNGVPVYGDPVAGTGGIGVPWTPAYAFYTMFGVGVTVTSVLGSPPSGYVQWEY